ncbi:MAG: hypothetical protein OES79_05265 [Planctomycetota bacterium]|nr:hypothetical protein [Planctomycetota bacterium]
MHPLTLKDVTVFALLLVVGVVGRFACLDIPNFQPTAAVALFAGFYFAQRRLALLVPLVVMAISNLWLDSYLSWTEMILVYAAFLWPVLLGRHLLRDQRSATRPAIRWGICLAAPSLVFFLPTNFGVWLASGLYPQTPAGLSHCYWLAIPFYGYSLAGDLVFAPVLFGAYHVARAGLLSCRPSAVATM